MTAACRLASTAMAATCLARSICRTRVQGRRRERAACDGATRGARAVHVAVGGAAGAPGDAGRDGAVHLGGDGGAALMLGGTDPGAPPPRESRRRRAAPPPPRPHAAASPVRRPARRRARRRHFPRPPPRSHRRRRRRTARRRRHQRRRRRRRRAGAAEAAASAASSSRRAAARRRGLWATALAPRWAVGAELARTLGALSLFTEAVRLFEELELWDEMVSCLIVLQRGWEAEDIVRRRLDDAKTATPAMQLLPRRPSEGGVALCQSVGEVERQLRAREALARRGGDGARGVGRGARPPQGRPPREGALPPSVVLVGALRAQARRRRRRAGRAVIAIDPTLCAWAQPRRALPKEEAEARGALRLPQSSRSAATAAPLAEPRALGGVARAL